VFLLGIGPDRDERYMREALALARRGAGTASPNPMVGAVVVSSDRVVGRGYHVRPGTPHAEVLALNEAGAAARGATLYVSLEPCAHWGRMPPCTDAIVAAGIRRVVIAIEDPDAQVRGRGCRRLAEAGVETSVGVGADGARLLNEAYVKHRTTGLPFVTAKWAMSLDGRIATRAGDARWISGAASRALVHELRAVSDAVLVGIGTVLRDDPQLTARGLPAVHRNDHQPVRIVLDSMLRIPPTARVLERDGTPVVVATTSRSPAEARRTLDARGAETIIADGPGGRVDLPALLVELGRRGITSLLIEGGETVHGAAFDAGLVDKVLVFVAPIILGGPAPGPVGGAGVERIAQAWHLAQVSTRQVDHDLVIEGYLPAPARAEAARREECGGSQGAAGRASCSPAS
jgi:diaminohydroxyphosphoribosylaminopyrimidine deaminase/5-amino-6-(5-phosphoribosylamino)uracil reductase